MGNGRTSRSPLLDSVQNRVDENNRKAVNLALFARPEIVPGLQTGFSIYLDRLNPEAGTLIQNPASPLPGSVLANPQINERIYAAYTVYSNSRFEFLNEAVLVQHGVETYRTFNTPAFYSQISRRWGSAKPYLRYQYIHANAYEPIFGDVGLRQGPQAGVRFGFNEAAAWKLQYEHAMASGQPAADGVATQIAFTF